MKISIRQNMSSKNSRTLSTRIQYIVQLVAVFRAKRSTRIYRS